MIKMPSVETALQLIVERAASSLLPSETAPLSEADGRYLAAPVVARVFQPPADVSAMDGYAVRLVDATPGARLRLIGESRAGRPFEGAVGPNEAVRIFTGAYAPQGADHILIQEDARADASAVTVATPQTASSFIRLKGRDFAVGDVLVPGGLRMTPGAIALAAAGNVDVLRLRRRLSVGVLANGDELVAPGAETMPGQVVNSIAPALVSQIALWGGTPVDLGVARDDIGDVRARLQTPCDLIVSIGGASVGDYDVARSAFAAEGFIPIFEKVAVKPGKPTWFSERNGQLALGLPGNPAAAMVVAHLFLKPLLEAKNNALPAPPALVCAQTETRLAPAGGREEYLRAILTLRSDGRAGIRPADDQDSSLLSPFLSANALIRRRIGSPAAAVGDLVEVVTLA